ncbi:MAG: DMT family transporter [Cognatishimia sp.]|uniref:DMT family transporter n=1 Tax=Cognatishimia sp. TaxID=2211648 RepID=UPI003B8BBE96
MSSPNNTLGFVLMSVTSFVFAAQDAISLHLAAEFNVFMIVMVRFWTFALFALILAHRNGGIRQNFQSNRPAVQWFRSILLPLEICVTVAAFTYLGLTESHAIFVCYPLIIVALSGPILGEKIGWIRWSAVLIGFVGVLIIVRPGFGVVSPWAMLPLLGAAMFALYGVTTRIAGLHDSATTSFLYIGVIGAMVMTIVGAFHWQMLAQPDVLWMIVLCLTGIFGHWLLIKTYEVAEASAVQPFAYLQMPFAAGFGVLIYTETVRLNVAIGAAIIVTAGLFVFWRERQVAQKQP